MGFVVDKVALGRLFSNHFGLSCQLSCNELLHGHE
jgi:hypothetical protein